MTFISVEGAKLDEEAQYDFLTMILFRPSILSLHICEKKVFLLLITRTNRIFLDQNVNFHHKFVSKILVHGLQ